MRQHGPLGPETVIWARLTALNHEIHEILSRDETRPAAGLRAQHFVGHALLTVYHLIPDECYSSSLSRSDRWILSISCFKHAAATHNLGPHGTCFFPGRIITIRA